MTEERLKPNLFKRFLFHYRPSWYLDALFFWSVFLCGAIFVLWLFNNTTKNQIRRTLERRIYSITQSTARLLDPNVLGLENQFRDYNSPAYLSKVSNLIGVIRSQNMEVSDVYLVDIRDGELRYFKRETREWRVARKDSPEYALYKNPVEHSIETRSMSASSWVFLNGQIFFFFTPQGNEHEFTIFPIEGWKRVNPSFNPVVIVVFDAATMRSELEAVDSNSSQVVVLALIFATIASIVTRRRSIQREEAVEQRFAALEILRERDQILGATISMADQYIMKRNLGEPFGVLLSEVKKVVPCTAIYLKTVKGGEHPVLGLERGRALGILDGDVQHFDPDELENPEWQRWRGELEFGHSMVGLAGEFPSDEKNALLSKGIQSIAVIPVRADRRLVAVVVIEAHKGKAVWEPGVLDTLTLAAQLLGSAVMRFENEEHLRHSSKMEALGRMGSGVAHEFNNLLHIVSGNLAILASKLADHPHLVHIVDGMLVATQRGSKIINQLLSATRQSEVVLHSGSINEVVERTITLAQATLPKGIYVKTELGESVPPVLLDDGLMQQVVLNLILNARDAVGSEGEIRIQTGVTMHPYLWDGQKYIFCRVLDSGPGIPEKILESIFDPFFTTKPQGQGTGLGLSTSRGILELHRGYIEAGNYSKGAVFTFYIPIPKTGDKSTVETERRAEVADARLKGGKVLVGDDEDMCLDLVGDILSEQSFEPVLAQGGEDMVRKAQELGDKIEWVITDWSMPGLSEEKLIRKIREILPKAKIIVTSGFLLHEKLPAECDGFIQKPFQPEALFALMRKIGSSGAERTASK